jgi:hypothetical protein
LIILSIFKSFRIIDDDIDLKALNTNEEGDMLADLLDPEGPMVVTGKKSLHSFI